MQGIGRKYYYYTRIMYMEKNRREDHKKNKESMCNQWSRMYDYLMKMVHLIGNQNILVHDIWNTNAHASFQNLNIRNP